MVATTFVLKTARARAECAEYVLNLPDGKPVMEVVIRPFRKKRSGQANSFYWACRVKPLANHFGYHKEEMHRLLLGTYYGWDYRDFRGNTICFPRRTTTTPETADTIDFMGLTQLAEQLAAENGVKLPDQDTQENIECKR